MKPLRYTLIIVTLVILAPVKIISKPKPMTCDPPTIVEVPISFPACYPLLGGTFTGLFVWAVVWGDLSIEDPPPSEFVTGTCETKWPCVPLYEDYQPEDVVCYPFIINAFGTTIQGQNVGVFVYQVASRSHTISTYACGSCYHAEPMGGDAVAVNCFAVPHQENQLVGPC